MSLADKVVSLFTGRRPEPVGTVHVVDPSPLNWLYVTYNTVEELVRVSPEGVTVPAAMRAYRWEDDLTLDVTLREGNRFPEGEPVTPAAVAQAFAEAFRWHAPHPPGTHFNVDPRTRVEPRGELGVRFTLPEPDGLLLGKLRAYHLMSTRFWNQVGFGYARQKSGEGHW